MDHEKAHQKLNTLANIIVALLFISTSISMVIFYQKTFYGNGWIEYTNTPFPTDKGSYSAGEIVSYHAEIVRTTEVRKTVSRTIQSACGDTYDLPLVPLSTGGEIGQFEFDEKSIFVPEWFKDCPRAWINGVTSYDPNKYRTIDVAWKTQEFEIKN